MMRSLKIDLIVLGIFVVLTLLMTYPTVFHMGSGVKDLGDPLLNTWIMAWNAQKILNLDIEDYFDANIFYPHKRTLAYSEHLFTQSLIGLPVLLVSQNPVFAYNFCLLFSFFTSGLGMFFLARYLTRSPYSGMVAGIIFAFSPFMFAHLGHLQVITAGGIPMAFLYLHKFLRYEQSKHLLLFSLFFLLQVLANGYYALYLSLFAGLYILVYLITEKRYTALKFWAKITVFVLIVVAVAGPFFRQYFLVRKEMGFARKMGEHANLTSFLATSPFNRLYGELTSPFLKQEGELFPGILAVVLAVLGFTYMLRNDRKKKSVVKKHGIIYSSILLLSFLFTFGSKGPYILLHKFVPGFDGLRVASRFHIFVMFSLAVLSAFGLKALVSLPFLRTKRASFVAFSLTFLILVEYFSVPVPVRKVRVKEDIPEVYKWLATQKENFAIIELPLPKPGKRVGQIECPRLHFSTYHWKKIVNGYSGYFPPLYDELKRRWQSMPLEQNIEDLRSLGVRYVIFHSFLYKPDEFENVMNELRRLESRCILVTQLEEACIYELIYIPEEGLGKYYLDRSCPLPRKDWTAFSNVKSHKTRLAYDGALSTRWETGPQRKGHFFELDLGQVRKISGFSLKLGTKPLDFPRGYRVEVSTDRKNWEIVAQEKMTILPITAFLRASDLSSDVVFSTVDARYIKITNTGEDEVYYWSIYEMDVFQ